MVLVLNTLVVITGGIAFLATIASAVSTLHHMAHYIDKRANHWRRDKYVHHLRYALLSFVGIYVFAVIGAAAFSLFKPLA